MAEDKLDESKDMSFWDHLEALRQGLFRVVLALLAAFVVLFFFKNFLNPLPAFGILNGVVFHKDKFLCLP